jgi:DNA replication and repair protein RecF
VIIKSLHTTAFRNLADALFDTSAKKVFLVGENGQGKTNFLEALYFCAYASSFRGVRDNEITHSGERDFSAAIVTSDNEIMVKFEKGKKTVLIDDKRLEDRKKLLSVVPCIVFCHEDMEFIAGSHERRRWFFDQVLSLYDPVYLDDLHCYRRVLKSRNSVLRDHVQHKLNGNPETLLDALDQQCTVYGMRLMEKRKTATEVFSEIFAPLYEKVSGIAGLNVQYIPSWKASGEGDITDMLLKRRTADLATGVSLSGPHRDRYVFTVGDTDFAGNASTGQRRLLALLLRVAQARRFSDMTGKKPVLLLDDVLLEMDGEKRRRFLSALPDCDQAFFTFLPEEPFQHYRDEDTMVYYVKHGRVKVQDQ